MTEDLTTSAILRIGRDVKDVQKTPIDNTLYVHSSQNVCNGYAVVIGADDTPYFGIPMFYKINFPYNYPHSPPKMRFLSYSAPNDTFIRMHPNYYVNGKCCLSILNTWDGDKWTSCQTIRSLLLTISMTLTADPIENEPGHKSCPIYRAIVADAGLYFLAKFLENPSSIKFSENNDENQEISAKFYDYYVNTYLKQNGELLLERLTDENSILNGWIKPYDNEIQTVRCYRLSTIINFSKTKEKIIPILTKLLEK